MSDAKLERTTSKLKLTITVKFYGFRWGVAFEGFLKVYLEGHDDDEEEQRMLPAMKSETSQQLLRQRSDIQDLRHAIQKLLWLKNWKS
jgi:DNA topoisomerase IA